TLHTLPTPHLSTLSLHDALPISANRLEISKPVLQIRLQVIPLRPLVPRIDEDQAVVGRATAHGTRGVGQARLEALWRRVDDDDRSEEHTSELQSRGHLVCRLLLE